jgi:hypothetical protein
VRGVNGHYCVPVIRCPCALVVVVNVPDSHPVPNNAIEAVWRFFHARALAVAGN